MLEHYLFCSLLLLTLKCIDKEIDINLKRNLSLYIETVTTRFIFVIRLFDKLDEAEINVNDSNR